VEIEVAAFNEGSNRNVYWLQRFLMRRAEGLDII
jgi:hypothetical protein